VKAQAYKDEIETMRASMGAVQTSHFCMFVCVDVRFPLPLPKKTGLLSLIALLQFGFLLALASKSY
jgi:hypothetical protein